LKHSNETHPADLGKVMFFSTTIEPRTKAMIMSTGKSVIDLAKRQSAKMVDV
jgi:hypothetical protein